LLPTNKIGIWHDLLCLALWAVGAELIFSISHYALHSKHLYWIHKQHHENNPTYSTSCLDAHPIEFFTGNVGSIALPMIMYPGSVAMSFFWIIFTTANTCHAHCIEGAHTIHHERFRYNYGQGGYVFDRIMGTFIIK
jgi:sterol desaturase/sphingolipid hydroxylase (fatty acid hydroxylase superfamily)